MLWRNLWLNPRTLEGNLMWNDIICNQQWIFFLCTAEKLIKLFYCIIASSKVRFILVIMDDFARFMSMITISGCNFMYRLHSQSEIANVWGFKNFESGKWFFRRRLGVFKIFNMKNWIFLLSKMSRRFKKMNRKFILPTKQ